MDLSDASEKIPSDTTGDRPRDLPTTLLQAPHPTQYIYLQFHEWVNQTAQNLRTHVQFKLQITKIQERISWQYRITYRSLQQHIYYRQQFIVQFVFFTKIPVHYFICRSCLFKWVTTDPCEHMRDSWEDTNGANKRRWRWSEGRGGVLIWSQRTVTKHCSCPAPSHRLYIQQVRKCTHSRGAYGNFCLIISKASRFKRKKNVIGITYMPRLSPVLLKTSVHTKRNLKCTLQAYICIPRHVTSKRLEDQIS